jgi:hypothetical protein
MRRASCSSKIEMLAQDFDEKRYSQTDLVDGFIVPVGVDGGKTLGNTVVFTGHQGVHTGQDKLLVDTDLTLKIKEMFRHLLQVLKI